MGKTNHEARRRLLDLARLQGGVFTRSQAEEVEVTGRMLTGMRRDGEIARVHAGVYRYCVTEWTWKARLRAAVLATRGKGCASHSSAARLLGIKGVATGRPEICVPHSGWPPLKEVRMHVSRALPDEDRTEIQGIACTTGSRTVIDLAARLEPHDRISLVDDAICCGAAERKRLCQRAEQLRNGRRGIASIIEVTGPGAEGAFWSALERAFGGVVTDERLPAPRYNAPLRHQGRLLYADALWEAMGLVVELHGLRFHCRPDDRDRDDERLNLLTLMGYRTLVFTWREVFDEPEKVAAQIRQALQATAA